MFCFDVNGWQRINDPTGLNGPCHGLWVTDLEVEEQLTCRGGNGWQRATPWTWGPGNRRSNIEDPYAQKLFREYRAPPIQSLPCPGLLIEVFVGILLMEQPVQQFVDIQTGKHSFPLQENWGAKRICTGESFQVAPALPAKLILCVGKQCAADTSLVALTRCP